MIVEGIEDGLTVYQSTGLPVWAAGSAPFMPMLAPAVPLWVEVVTIVADDDHAGQDNARKLAAALYRRGNPRGSYRMNKNKRPDLNDTMREPGGGPDAVNERLGRAKPFPPPPPENDNTTTKGNGHDASAHATAQTPPLFDPWQRFIVPPFPIDILPPVAQSYVREHSEVIGCDASGVAMSTLTSFSGALHHGFALKMMRHSKWQVSPRLWVLLVADASQRKTPILLATTAPLVRYQIALQEKYEAELRDYEEALATDVDSGLKPRKPNPPPRYVVNDTTVEKLSEMLARSDKGILVESKELSGWIASMERYASGGKSADRSVWLTAYDGGAHWVDRIKRGEIFIRESVRIDHWSNSTGKVC